MAEQRLVYHWKHGWIPLTHAAALSKAKGNNKLADKYVRGTSAHHLSVDTHGKSAAQIHGGLGHHARIMAHPGTFRGEAGHHITGTDTHGRRVKVFVPGDRAAAQKAIDNIHGGKPAFDTPNVHTSGTKPPATAAEAFRMGGPELRQHAANGSSVAQTELDRRTAKHGKPATHTTPTAPTAPKRTLPDSAPKQPQSHTPVDKSAEALARWNAENQRITPAGHTIASKPIGTTTAGTPQGFHLQHTANGDRVGSVIEQRDGSGYRAVYEGNPIGVFPTRAEAHAALAEKHRAVSEATAAKAARDAVTRDRKTSKAVQGLPAWQTHQFQSDGSRAGNAAAAKIKQSFKTGNHTVHIETAMTHEQTKAFLNDVHSVLLKANMHDHPDGIVFHVPSGDKNFRMKRNRVTGGYVRHGQRTVFVNPKVANGSMDFGQSEAGGHLMQARDKTNGRQYVITHELGHVLDGAHGHTLGGGSPLGAITPGSTSGEFHRQQRGQLSRYGQSNVAEGYAEAYAQWIHGGPGSNAAADAFAAQYGWKPPKWYREGRK